MNSPATRNAISRQLLGDLRSVLSDFQNRPLGQMPRAIVLEGIPGVAFSAGADLKERAGMSQEEVWEFLDGFRNFLDGWEKLPVPTIAGIGGFALGGGMEIALACDFRLAIDTAILGLPETRLGIIPGAGGTQRLSRLVGISRAKEWIFQGKKITASYAQEWGAVDYSFSQENFPSELQKFAEGFLESAPLSIRASKMAIQEGFELTLEKGLDRERYWYKTTIDSQDRREALDAFREKRKPIFKGE